LGVIRDDVQIEFRIAVPKVDVWRQQLVLERENADDGFDGPGRA
jgi:hypothetical protein